jgi:hypothetical protein
LRAYEKRSIIMKKLHGSDKGKTAQEEEVFDTNVIQRVLKGIEDTFKNDTEEKYLADFSSLLADRVNQTYPEGDLTQENLYDLASEPIFKDKLPIGYGIYDYIEDVWNLMETSSNVAKKAQDEEARFEKIDDAINSVETAIIEAGVSAVNSISEEIGEFDEVVGYLEENSASIIEAIIKNSNWPEITGG